MARGVLSAVVMVALMFAIDGLSYLWGDAPLESLTRDYWWIYAALIAASALMTIDVLDSATHARRSARKWSADGWMYAYAVGVNWGVPMVLIMWRPELANWLNIAIWGSAGAFFGIWMNILFDPDQPSHHKRFGGFEAIEHFYADRKSTLDYRFGTVSYYGWPIISLFVLVWLAGLSSDDIYFQLMATWQLVLITSLSPRFQAADWIRSPRFVGTMFFVFAVFATYATSMP